MGSGLIRAGIKQDIPSIIDMAREFWGHTIYNETYDPDTVWSMSELCIDHGLMSVLDLDGAVVGFACALKGTLLANSDVSTGTEIAWWVSPDYREGRNGIALLKHIESLAKEAGIKYWNMVYMQSSMPESIKKIYERMGYTKTEIIYSKVL